MNNLGQFIGLARALNSKAVTYSLTCAKAFCSQAQKLGMKVEFHIPHEGYSYHMHLFSGGKKISGVHIQIAKSVYDYLIKLFK